MELSESIKLRTDIEGEKRDFLIDLVQRMNLDPRHALETAVLINPETKTHQNAYCFNHDLIRNLNYYDEDGLRFLIRARGGAFVELYDNNYLTQKDKLKVFHIFQHECNTLMETEAVCKAFEYVSPEQVHAEYMTCSKGVCVREQSLGLEDVSLPISSLTEDEYCFDRMKIVDSLTRYDPGINPDTGRELPLNISNILRTKLDLDIKMYRYYLDVIGSILT